MNESILELLNKTKIQIAPETYFLISLQNETWLKLLENPEASPRMTAPFMIFKDNFEVTLLLDKTDFRNVRPSLHDAKIESGLRLLTFDIELDLTVVGFFAEISRILAEAEIPIIALSAFSRDHVLVKQDDLPKALVKLGRYVADVC